MNLRMSLLILGIAILSATAFTDVLQRSKTSTDPKPVTAESGVVGVIVVSDSTSPRPIALEKAPPTEDVSDSPVIATTHAPDTPETPLATYISVRDSCGPYYTGDCLNVRSGPSTSSPSIGKIRNGMVLKTSALVSVDGYDWYKVFFDEWVRYPERLNGEWYVAADYVQPFLDSGAQELTPSTTVSTTKSILVNRTEEMLYAYEDSTLFMKQAISTGLELTPTPRGTFKIYKKTPSRYMQGPLPGISDQYYDLPGVPWNLYFTAEGGAIHGAYWHDHFGSEWSHGCVNMPPDKARELYFWADIGTPVTVRD